MSPTPTPVVETPQQVPTQQQTDRESVQQKYEKLYGTPPVDQPSTPQPTVTTTSTSVPDPNTVLLAELQSMKAEIASLKPPPPPPAPEPVLTPWFEQLRQGKFEEAEQELENRIRAKIESQATTRATDQAFEAMKVQIEVDRYLNDLRGQNPDLVDWEPYLTAPVEKRIGQARVEGKIKNSDDFLRIYKDSVKAEVDTLREKTLKYRAQGQQNATTRINDVRNASTLQPQAVTSTPSEQTSEAPIETVDSYIARRQQASQKAHGMV